MSTENKVELFEVDLKHKKVKVRKWKAKDRKNFKKAMLEITEDNVENIDKKIFDSLVIPCIEDKSVALSNIEKQYILTYIRKISLGNSFKFKYTCDKCNHENNIELKIDDVSKYNPSDLEIINGIEFSDIMNKKFYDENSDETDEIKEMAFRIKSINSDTSKGFNEVVEYLEDLEIVEFDELFDAFKKMFPDIDNFYTVICEKCSAEKKYEFDEIPGFIPDNWLK